MSTDDCVDVDLPVVTDSLQKGHVVTGSLQKVHVALCKLSITTGKSHVS